MTWIYHVLFQTFRMKKLSVQYNWAIKNLSFFKGMSQNSIELVLFHSALLILLFFIRVFVGSIILGYLENSIVHRRAWSAFSNKILPEPEFWLEYVWIGWPSVILLFCLTKGLGILYKVDRIISPELTVKITGYQWFWTYELSDIWYWVIKKRPFLNASVYPDWPKWPFMANLVNWD